MTPAAPVFRSDDTMELVIPSSTPPPNDADSSEEIAVVNSDDDVSVRSSTGYDADAESQYSLKERRKACNGTCRRKKRSVEDVDEGAAFEEEPLNDFRRRRRHRRQKVAANCSWIERIFSSTPYVTPEDSDAFPTAWKTKIVPLNRASPACECLRGDNLDPSMFQAGVDTPKDLHHDPHLSLFPLTNHESAPADSSNFVQMGMASALMDKLNLHKVDDEVLTLGLLSIVNDLLRDSYKIQATYRSYSFNGGEGGSMESFAVTKQT